MKPIPYDACAGEKIEVLHKAAQESLAAIFSEPGTIQLVGVNFCFADENGNRIEVGIGEVKSEDDDEADPVADFDAYTCEPGCSYTLGSQAWVMTERWDPAGRTRDGHDLLFRNKNAPQIARWVHPDELQQLHALGVVRTIAPIDFRPPSDTK
jgi:hypothetical protein